jgi:hypothetical protein
VNGGESAGRTDAARSAGASTSGEPFATPAARSPWLSADRALIAILLAFAAWIASAREADFDFWYHMAAGREIVESGRILFTDSFTHTAAGHAYPPTEWLFQVMLYGLHAAFGIAGVVLYKTIFVTAWAALLVYAGRSQGASAAGLAMIVGLGLLAAVPRYLARPEWVTFAGAALLTAYVLDEERGRAWSGWRAAVPPAATLVWANAHPGVFFGVLIVVAHAAARLGLAQRTRARARDVGGVRRQLAIAAACVAASFATPASAGNLSFLLAHANVFERLGVEEFQPLPLIPELGFIWFYLAIATALCLVRVRELSIASRVLALVFLVLALRNLRLVPLFIVVSAPLAAPAVDRILAPLLARRRSPRRAAAAAALATLAACAAVRIAQRPMWGPIAFALDESIVPVGAADFLEANQVSARLYNFQGYGNYLIWRGFQVATDARLPLHEKTFVAFARKPFDTMERLGITAAVVPPPSNANYEMDGVAGLLARRGDTWALVYSDSVAMVFLKRGAGLDDLIGDTKPPPAPEGRQ